MQSWFFNLQQPSLNRRDNKKKSLTTLGNIRIIPAIVTATVIIAILLLLLFHRTLIRSKDLCSKKAKEFVPLTNSETIIAAEFASTASPLVAIIHYATLRWIPSQSPGEIRRIFDVIQYLAPCNFLIFGIGHDSMIWDTINPGGNTVFLEENPKWTLSALKRFPILRIHTVRYPTRQSQADTLLSSYKKHCSPGHTLKESKKCPLALSELPEEIYERDWDVIFIDAPRGALSSAAGRMAVIYSAAIMARWRKRSGVTHVFLHDADRKVEQQYAQEFLCMKYRVGGVRRLWHFVIPPAFNGSDSANDGFC